MQLSSQEEYGLRCLLRIAELGREKPLVSIAEVSLAEGISQDYVAKLLRIYRQAALLESVRGKAGGYRLARPPADISVWDALSVVGTPLYESSFCQSHSGSEQTCVRQSDCSIRALWQWTERALHHAYSSLSLETLLHGESVAVASLHQSQRPKTTLVQLGQKQSNGVSL